MQGPTDMTDAERATWLLEREELDKAIKENTGR